MSQKNNTNNKNNRNRQNNNRSNNNRGGKPSGARAAAVDNKSSLSRLWLLPLAFVIIVVPLITVIHVYDCGLESNPWFSIGGTLYDFFLYYKAFFLRLAGVLVLFVLAYLVPFSDHSFLKEKRTIAPSIAIGIFGLVSLGSSLMAEHTSEALFGGYEQFEGWFVYLTYILCFYLAFGYVRTKELIRFILDVVLIGAFIIGLLGTFQAMGMDWIRSGWAKPILAAEVSSTMDMSNFSIKLNFGEGVSYVTLYNPNYVGSYVALILPYAGYLILRGEKIWRRILAGATAIMLIVTLLASQSLTGIIGLMAGAVLCVILVIPSLKKARPFMYAALGIAVAGIAAVFILQPAFLSKLFNADELYTIDSMTSTDNSIEVHTGYDQDIHVAFSTELENGWAQDKTVDQVVSLTDSDGNEIPLQIDPSTGIGAIHKEGYVATQYSLESRELDENALAAYLQEYERITGKSQAVSVSSGDGTQAPTRLDLLHITDWSHDWAFTLIDHKLYFYTGFGRFDQMPVVKKAGFEGRYHFASRRGYIWSRTFPLLTDSLLFGCGRDQFVYTFPNDDYIGKNYMGYDLQTITKPHNLFLQIWSQDGLPTLLAFLFLYFLFLIRAFRTCMGKNRSTPEPGIDLHGFVIVSAVATTAYMVVGLANDSTITVAPIFWCLLGAGYAAEATLAKKRKEAAEIQETK